MNNEANQPKELNINFAPLGKGFRPLIAGLVSLLIITVVVFLFFATKNEIKTGRYIGQDIQYKNSINVSGEGRIEVKPDIGTIDLSVVSEAVSVVNAQKDNTDKMNKIIQAMQDLGIDQKDLKTTNYNISPKYQYTSGKTNIIGYTISQTLKTKLRGDNINKIDAILNKATELGANQIGSLSFTFDNPEELKFQARKLAIDNAKEKARTLAKELGVELVRVIDFSEASTDSSAKNYYSGFGLGGEASAPAPAIQTGQNEIVSNVTLTYEIQ